MNRILCLLMVIIGLAGCASDGPSYTSYGPQEGAFFDGYGDYRLVRKNNDVWLEKLEGNESRAVRQITHTPNINESIANFSKDGKYILFCEYYENGGLRKYRIEFDKDDQTRVLVSDTEYSFLVLGNSN